MNFLPWVIGGSFALGVAAWAIAVSSRKPMLAKGDKLWVIGDSLGVGLLPRLKKLGDAAGIFVGGNPKGGTMTFQWAKKSDLLEPALDFQAHTALVILGTNDAAAGEDYINEKFPSYVQSLAGRFLDEGLRVIWLAPGTSPGLTHDRTDAIAETIFDGGSGLGFAVLDTNEAKVEYVQKDVHPTPAGYDTLAAWIVDRITT